ncbi:MAG: NAD(+)/NADH kinase [Clostridium sp.]|nr:NAD(+)/NADH kinase [Prevotella sp.]MCM1428551.1 NAD(+)/NADH kinase [Clostridium sp.]MCM1475015.1 NAD(+)/NADH kinase [Muribaculaceae bacterium]
MNSHMRNLPIVKKVAITGNTHQDEYIGRIIEFIVALLSRGLLVGVREKFLKYISGDAQLPPGIEALPDDAPTGDAVVSIGGDGTYIKTARWVGSQGIPIMGLNTGHLGFLANYSIDEISELIEVLLSGRATVESRTLLELQSGNMPKDFYPYALNEVALVKEETSSMITANVTVDSDFLASYKADGLIVSTPTGSTAYNLSVGGPIIHPSMDCMVLSPVAPHTLTLRPIVIDGDSKVEVVVSSRARDFRVSVDGNSFILRCGEVLRISRAPFVIHTIRRPGDNFASTMRNKLLWGSNIGFADS